jgi:hypothetical protein
MKSKATKLPALLTVFVVAACGDDPTGTSNLTEAQAQEVASAVFTSAFLAFTQIPQEPPTAADGPALAPYSHEFSWEGTAPCPGGGNASVVASGTSSGDTESLAGTADIEFTSVHNGCVVQSASGPITLNGNPSIVVDMSYESDAEGDVSFDGGINGAVDYAFDGEDGTCSIAYAFSGSVAGQSTSFSVSGNVCGVSIEQQVNVG